MVSCSCGYVQGHEPVHLLRDSLDVLRILHGQQNPNLQEKVEEKQAVQVLAPQLRHRRQQVGRLPGSQRLHLGQQLDPLVIQQLVCCHQRT
jgi:hypothetical protein